MKYISRLTLTLLACTAVLLSACSKAEPKKDGVINVEDTDAEMNAAIAKARATLPEFWRVFEHPDKEEEHFSLKVKITDENGTEHFWTTDLERTNGKIMGTIGNDADVVKSVKLNQRIEIPEADISDWLYMRDGKMYGNRTVVPLFKQMSPEEVQQFKSIMVEQ